MTAPERAPELLRLLEELEAERCRPVPPPPPATPDELAARALLLAALTDTTRARP